MDLSDTLANLNTCSSAYLCAIEFPTIINWRNPISSLRAVANSAEPDQAMHFVASDWVVHCLPMPHKVDPRLTWVKTLTSRQMLVIISKSRGGGGLSIL